MIDGIVSPALAGQNKLGDRHKGITFLKQRLDNTGQGLRCVESRIVKQDNGAGLCFAYHPLGDICCRKILPVQAVTVPYRFKALISGLYTFSKKVSGLFGSNTSLQVITVTRSSVSDRLTMLCVQPGII